MEPPFLERMENYIEPGMLLGIAIYHFAITVLNTVFVDHAPLALFRLSELRDKAFSAFWLAISPPAAPLKPGATPPPLEGPLSNLPAYLADVHGTVLEIGPGSGCQTVYFKAPQITTIYGAEPVRAFHPALEESAAAAGLGGGKYRPLVCGGEKASLLPGLADAGVLSRSGSEVVVKGVFDAIVCVRVLCSVADPAAAVDNLYELLKPGGKIVFCEHVVNPWRTAKGSVLGRAFQVLWMALGWHFFFGNCRLDQDTVELLKMAGDKKGGWESVEMEKSLQWAAIPFVTGVLAKKA